MEGFQPRGPTPQPEFPPDWINSYGEQPLPGFGSDAPEWQRHKSVTPPDNDEQEGHVQQLDGDDTDGIPIPGVGEELHILPEVESWDRYKKTVLDDYSAENASIPSSIIPLFAYSSFDDVLEPKQTPQKGRGRAPKSVSPTKPRTKSPTKQRTKSPVKPRTASPQKTARPSASTSAPAIAPPSPYKKVYARPSGTRSSNRLAQQAENSEN